jgi:ubiquinone/menaquinone biosynthesis C-methylase UbiE
MIAPITLDETSCLICDSTESVPSEVIRYRDTNLHYHICTRCGFKYMNPKPTREWYRKLYHLDFWEEKARSWNYNIPLNESTKQKLIKRFLYHQDIRTERILRVVESVSLSATSTVVEIGSSWGRTLLRLREETNCAVYSVEPSSWASGYATENYNIPLLARFAEDLSELHDLDGQIDLLIMSHVLENTSSPLQVLQTAYRMLKDGGHLFVDTPNFYYFYNAANGYHPHIFRFETLEALLNQTGFRVIGSESEPHPDKATQASNVYLSVLAQKDTSREHIPAIDVEDMLTAQARGFQMIMKNQRIHLWINRVKRALIRYLVRALYYIVPN